MGLAADCDDPKEKAIARLAGLDMKKALDVNGTGHVHGTVLTRSLKIFDAVIFTDETVPALLAALGATPRGGNFSIEEIAGLVQLATEAIEALKAEARAAPVPAPAGAPQAPAVEFSMKLDNVNYTDLTANAALAESFTACLKESVAASAGDGVEPEHVQIALSSGSVVAGIKIIPPAGVLADNVASSLGSGSVSGDVLAKVLALPGIGDICTGEIGVAVIDAPRVAACDPAEALQSLARWSVQPKVAACDPAKAVQSLAQWSVQAPPPAESAATAAMSTEVSFTEPVARAASSMDEEDEARLKEFFTQAAAEQVGGTDSSSTDLTVRKRHLLRAAQRSIDVGKFVLLRKRVVNNGIEEATKAVMGSIVEGLKLHGEEAEVTFEDLRGACLASSSLSCPLEPVTGASGSTAAAATQDVEDLLVAGRIQAAADAIIAAQYDASPTADPNLDEASADFDFEASRPGSRPDSQSAGLQLDKEHVREIFKQCQPNGDAKVRKKTLMNAFKNSAKAIGVFMLVDKQARKAVEKVAEETIDTLFNLKYTDADDVEMTLDDMMMVVEPESGL